MVTLLLAFRQMISSDGQTCNHFLILCAGLQLHMLTKSIITVYVTKRPYYFIEVWSSLFSGLQFVQPQKCYLCGGLEGPPNGKFWGGGCLFSILKLFFCCLISRIQFRRLFIGNVVWTWQAETELFVVSFLTQSRNWMATHLATHLVEYIKNVKLNKRKKTFAKKTVHLTLRAHAPEILFLTIKLQHIQLTWSLTQNITSLDIDLLVNTFHVSAFIC